MTLDLLKLARPKQWLKGVFVLIGPLYGAATGVHVDWTGVAFAFLAFGLSSSACYVINDIRDAELDRAHPRKQHRPIASGRVAVPAAWVFAAALLAASAAVLAARPVLVDHAQPRTNWLWLAACVAAYVLNVNMYSSRLKRVVVLDVVSLALGFVLRVLGGCAAGAVEPSTWLLNCTLFVSMFLAFGKRLGERRTMGNPDAAAGVRSVQSAYTDESLRMFLVVTGVACLVTYSGYVQAQAGLYTPTGAGRPGSWGFNLLWLTMLPATFGLLRCVVQVERGVYDDPTELATRDRPFQAAVVFFGLLTAVAVVMGHPAGPR